MTKEELWSVRPGDLIFPKCVEQDVGTVIARNGLRFTVFWHGAVGDVMFMTYLIGADDWYDAWFLWRP